MLLLFIRPSDNGFPLPMKSDMLFYYFVVQKVNRIVLLLDEDHFVLVLAFVFYAEITSSKIMPSSFLIKLVELCSKLVWRGPIKVDGGIINQFQVVVHFAPTISLEVIYLPHLIHVWLNLPQVSREMKCFSFLI